jgi:NitT/TauT family transport system permease protein
MAKRLVADGKITASRASSVIFFLALAGLLELIARAGLISPLYFPPPSRILASFFRLTVDGILPTEIYHSFIRMAAGYFLAVLLMVPLGVSMGVSRRVYNLCEPLLELLRPLPPPVIVPVAMLFLGIGNSMKIFVVFFACAFPIIINTIDGVRSVHPVLYDTGRTFGLQHHQLVGKVILPAATPQIMAGLRTSLPISLIVTILAEMVGSSNGIGHYILRMQRTFDIPEMYAGTFLLGIVGYLLNRGFLGIDRVFLAWYKGWKRAGR